AGEHAVVGELCGARGEVRVPVPVEHGAAEAMVEHGLEGFYDGAILDQRLDDPVLAVRVDVDDGDMAELGVHVADAGDGGAVVGTAAHQDEIARAERNVVPGVEGGGDKRVPIRTGEPALAFLAVR